MRFRFIAVPAMGGEAAEAELNAFLGAHRVLTVDRQLVADGGRSYWAVCVAWIESSAAQVAVSAGKKPRIDYREVLSGEEFALFARVRALRKAISDRDGVPVYAVFSNEQLAEMVRRPPATVAEFAQLAGVGPGRAASYGRDFIDALRATASQPEPEPEASAPGEG